MRLIALHILQFLSAALLLSLQACSDAHDRRLERIYGLADTDPKAAMAALDSIDPSTLGKADRHFRDLLAVKTADKAYVRHTSDSLILDVIDYYSSRHDDDLTAEALYYGGRVYSDMGDSPSALRYFQDALELLPADTRQQYLRSCVLSQTGRLLNDLRLNEQAIAYVEESLSISEAMNDSIGVMFDSELAAAIHISLGNFTNADIRIRQACDLAKAVAPEEVPAMEITHALIQSFQNNKGEAVNTVQASISETDSSSRRWALANAAFIYNKAGINDTAAMYAKTLLRDTTDSYQMSGYKVLFSPEIIKDVPADSIIYHANAYFDAMNRNLRQNASTAALMQNSMFNYRKHLRVRLEAEKSRSMMERLFASAIILALALLAIILYMKHRNARNIIELDKAQDIIRSLRETIAKNDDTAQSPTAYEKLKARLIANLTTTGGESSRAEAIEPVILTSSAYSKVKDRISHEKCINESNSLWTELEKVVLECSKDFKTGIQILSGGNLDDTDYHLLLLMRCGLRPKELKIISGVTAGTITYRRKKIRDIMFGPGLRIDEFDTIIRSL